MNAKEKARHESLARVVKSLAHPARLFLVAALEKSELNVGQLTKLVGADVSTVSKHLTLLHNAGVLAHRKEGLRVFYSWKSAAVAKFFDCVTEIADSVSRGKQVPAKAKAKTTAAVKPVAKSVVKPVAKSVVKPVAKSVVKPVAKPVVKTAAKRSAKGAAKKPSGRRR